MITRAIILVFMYWVFPNIASFSGGKENAYVKCLSYCYFTNIGFSCADCSKPFLKPLRSRRSGFQLLEWAGDILRTNIEGHYVR